MYENDQNVTLRHQMSECYLKNGADRLGQGRAATNPWFVKNINSGKYAKARYAYIEKLLQI